ncbi:PREDICTED: allograft inflammatory factor 1-like isoform X1 [Branchiostoma belcheri]|uniref:Allograft inflammatory factor 1-like isoform X1 n=1 Tax=Branchiostoma belcheri TaxID=7741 RepID=A0A6P4YL21_BRABE|nr:PREDICTED: allograft inflammatory factor 1-like isoform X1 [Branchiostoma belcheri]
MPTLASADSLDYQGGKQYGELKRRQEEILDEINQEFLTDDDYKEVEDLADRLESSKKTFMEMDENNNGELGMMEVKRMMEKLDQAKTHLELKKMINEVDTTGRGVITYRDFLGMMLGSKSSVLKLILMFEEKRKEKERPKGVAPKRDLSSLP